MRRYIFFLLILIISQKVLCQNKTIDDKNKIISEKKPSHKYRELTFSLSPSYNISDSDNRGKNTFGYSIDFGFRSYWKERKWFWGVYAKYKYRIKTLQMDRLDDLVDDDYNITEKVPLKDKVTHTFNYLNLKGSLGYRVFSNSNVTLYIEGGLEFPLNIYNSKYLNGKKYSSLGIADIYWNPIYIIPDPFMGVWNEFLITEKINMYSEISYTLENIFLGNIRPAFHSFAITIGISYSI